MMKMVTDDNLMYRSQTCLNKTDTCLQKMNNEKTEPCYKLHNLMT